MIQRMTFSTVSEHNLKKAGVKRKRLIFKSEKISKLTEGLTPTV